MTLIERGKKRRKRRKKERKEGTLIDMDILIGITRL
jgi:hypothetical protein